MIVSDILNFSRAQTQTNSDGLTDDNGLIFANEALQDFHRRLVAKGVDASQLQEAYTDATANQGTYLYPSDMLFLKTIELNYTDTQPNNYQLATQVDISNIPGQSSFSWLRGNSSRMTPQFDDHGDWFEIFPTPLSSDSLPQLIRLFYFLQPTLFTDVTSSVLYPDNLDTALLGWRICASYLYSLGTARIPDGDKFNAKYEERVTQYIATLARGSQQPIQATSLQIDGFQF